MNLQIIFWKRLKKKNRDLFKEREKFSPPTSSCTNLPDFKSLTEEQILALIHHIHHPTCAIDPCNTKCLMNFNDTPIGTITKIINISLITWQYLDEWKITTVRPLTKGPNLSTDYKNYCPISNLSFMSKLIKKAAQTQLMTHFTQQNLLPKYQNANRKISHWRLPHLIFVTTSGPTWKS